MSKHTPGPWVSELNSYEQTIRTVPMFGDDTGLSVAAVEHFVYFSPNEEELANARLIAAAPEMYVLVDHMKALLRAADPMVSESLRHAIRSITCKAEDLLTRIDDA